MFIPKVLIYTFTATTFTLCMVLGFILVNSYHTLREMEDMQKRIQEVNRADK